MTVKPILRPAAVACLLFTAMAASLGAQQPAESAAQPAAGKPFEASNITDNASDYVPGELKFSRADEPYPIEAAQPGPTYALQTWKAAVLHASGRVMPGSQSTYRMKPLSQAHLDSMIQQTDKSLLPNADVLAFFRQAGEQLPGGGSPSDDRRARSSYVFYRRLDAPPATPIGDDRQRSFELMRQALREYGPKYERGEFEFIILGPPDKIEEIARTLLLLLNQVYALPVRRQVVEKLKTAQEGLQVVQTGVEQARQKLDQLEVAWQEVAGLEPIAKETLIELKTKRALLTVERAGSVARIQAAQRMAGRDQQPYLLAAKANAEIDLAGVTGQMKEIERLVNDADRREKARSERALAQNKLHHAEQAVESAKAAVEFHTENFEATAPYRLLDDAIVIHPIAWPDAKD